MASIYLITLGGINIAAHVVIFEGTDAEVLGCTL
jgi:hypothetical protein